MKKLNRKIKVFNKDIKHRIKQFKIAVAKTILWNLIHETPVDTSRALSNWIVKLGQPKARVIAPHYFGSRGSTQALSSNTAYMLGSAIIQRAKVGEIIYISNDVDYIELLNKGYSNQAESGFIEQSVQHALDVMKKGKL